ncbi:MAG: histidinol dehydrogenase [Chloroflexota bacterium]
MRRVQGMEQARLLLRRGDPLDALQGTPQLREGIRSTFGEPLSPVDVVERIIKGVRSGGDSAVIDYTRTISGIRLTSLEVSRGLIEAAPSCVSQDLLTALSTAAERITRYHEATKVPAGIHFVDKELGQKCVPLQRVGLYVPGGRYAYPSSVLMSAIPARVAGVEEVSVITPPGPDGNVAAVTLAACHIAGVDRVFAAGGAQAIAALAYGTESVPRVDKICGPGNVFVTIAKRMVFGSVAIDSLAGPSEVLIIADSSASAAYCAADLLAQAEHDPDARVALVTTSSEFADAVEAEVCRQVGSLERKGQIEEALDSAIIATVESLDCALELTNEFAPEHLELLISEPASALERIRNAGCICLGGQSPVVMGDYIDGPSHVLPTGGAARFSSVLGVHDFMKYSSVAQLSDGTMSSLGPAAITIARAEGLEAHARAVEVRLNKAD